jgi:flap endonuclease-1
MPVPQDVLVYEAPLVRNMTSRLGPLQLIAGADVRAALGLDRAAFVDWTLLLGTDFSQRIRNVGPARALKLIRAHGRIEHILAAEAKHPPRVPVPAYLAQVAAARAVFSALPPIPADVDLTQRPPDDARVGEVLRKYGIHAQDFDWESCDAEPIGDDYFGDGPGAGAADQDFGFVPFR